MTTQIGYAHIEKPAGDTARLTRMPRVRVAQIAMDYLTHGWSPDEICRQHPALRPAEVYSALAYYFDHSAEIEQEIERELEEVRSGRSGLERSGVFLRIESQRRA